MPSRGRHQSTSKACHRVLRQVEALRGVKGVIIGRSYGGKSLGRGCAEGSLRVQRREAGGIKAVMQSSRGVQEIFVRTEASLAGYVEAALEDLR